MEFDHNKVRQVVEEDRLSSLPDDLIHKIMSSFDIKFVVQTCLLLSRWKLLWTSMPYLNFTSYQFGSSIQYSKFVSKVLSLRNHQTEVSSIKLNFQGELNQVFVRKIADFAFSHNVQELDVFCCPKPQKQHQYPPCLLIAQSFKNFTLSTHPSNYYPTCVTPKTPWDFPALTTLHLKGISLHGYNTRESVDLFSKCVNLKNLTLECFSLNYVKVFDIITPRLSNLVLQSGTCPKIMNVIAPQLENLTIDDCSINSSDAPPGLSSFCYSGDPPPQLCKDGFHFLNKVSIFLNFNGLRYKEEDALKIINMLQDFHSARYIKLNMNVVECISAFPDLLSHHPSPFSNLISLTIIHSNMTKDACQVKMSTEARNFFLDNSPNATFNIELLPEGC